MKANRTKNLWKALEAIPGCAAVMAEWWMRLGADQEPAQCFLRPNGKLASWYPCIIPQGCGCGHDVVIHAPDDIVAVCHCERGCETFALKRSEIVVYELDRVVLEAALVDAFGLFTETDSKTDLRGTTRLGVYSPYAGFRFPVFLTIRLERNEFDSVVDGLLSRIDKPFILLAPTRDLCTARTEQRLVGRQSTFVPLSEHVIIGDKGKLQLLYPLNEILSRFRATNLPSKQKQRGMVFFPTPADAVWGNVYIRFKDGHTVSIKVKSAGGVFNYTQMGMANKKNGEPTKQWKLLEAFAEGKGFLNWDSPQADRKNQKRRETLATNLLDFFHIASDGDPFCMTDDGKGWKARFHLFPEE